MLDETPPEVESDLRRRAAWLLGMLAVVVALLLFVMTQVLGGGGSNDNSNGGPRPLDSYVNGPTSRHTSSRPATHSASHPSTRASATTGAPSTPPAGTTSCPTQSTCVLDGDVGQGVAAINAYRSTHGQPAVSGSVGTQAQQCALHNGNGCSGGWAETEVAKPDGNQAVQKILPFGKLLDPNLKTFEVGWAYDPRAKLYYFAIIRND